MALYDSNFDSDAFVEDIINTPTDYSVGISRTYRTVPPGDYLYKIQSSYPSLMKKTLGKVESDYFQAGGYTWKLILYPSGNLEGDGKGHVSLYLAIVNTKKFSHGGEVNVNFKLFVFDHKKNYYLTVQGADGAVSTFSEDQTEHGFDQLISLKNLFESYLVEPAYLCVFGAEVFVIGNSSNKGGSLSVINKYFCCSGHACV